MLRRVPPERVATSARESGTVDWRTVAALAAHFGGGEETPGDTPLIVSGAAPQGLGEHGPVLAMAALIHAAGTRKDAVLSVGADNPGAQVLVAAAHRLGWAHTETARAGSPWAARRGVALFRAGKGNADVIDTAARMAQAGIPVTCWCDQCGPVPLTGPCSEHSLDWARAAWQARTWVARAAV